MCDITFGFWWKTADHVSHVAGCKSPYQDCYICVYIYMYFVNFASSYSTTKIRLPITIHALYKRTVIVVGHFVKT